MHVHGNQDDPWVEFRKRRDEWRARREARRSAWRARRTARRAACGHGWGGWGDPAFWGVDAASWGMGDGAETAALKAKVEAMEKTIASLNERIVVLEKLAVGGNDARLAAEIEKLRGD
jgi:hypothetical protein